MGRNGRRLRAGVLSLIGLAFLTGCATGDREAPAASAQAKILHFYASQRQAPRGSEVLVCYGVEGAESLRLMPIEMQLSPSPNRCVAVTHSESTDYVLEVTGAGQTIRSEPVRVAIGESLEGNAPSSVAPGSAGAGKELIRFFSTSAQQVSAGEMVTFCYGTVSGVESLRLEPAVATLAPASQKCFDIAVNSTQTYILRATGAGGASDAMQVKVAVN